MVGLVERRRVALIKEALSLRMPTRFLILFGLTITISDSVFFLLSDGCRERDIRLNIYSRKGRERK